jgi:hypothetical protein
MRRIVLQPRLAGGATMAKKDHRYHQGTVRFHEKSYQCFEPVATMRP